MDDDLNAWKGTNLLAKSVPPVPDTPPPEPPSEFPEISEPPGTIFTEDTFVNGQPCPPGPIRGWLPDAEPVKLSPATYTLNAVTDATSPPAGFTVAKQVALPARSITMVPVQIQGAPNANAKHVLAPEQRFGENLVVPEGLYDQCLGTTDTYQVLVVNEGEQPLLLDLGHLPQHYSRMHGCGSASTAPEARDPAHPAKIPEFEPQTGSGTGSPTRDLAGRGCHRTFKFCLEQSPGAHKEEGREHAMGRGLSGVK